MLTDRTTTTTTTKSTLKKTATSKTQQQQQKQPTLPDYKQFCEMQAKGIEVNEIFKLKSKTKKPKKEEDGFLQTSTNVIDLKPVEMKDQTWSPNDGYKKSRNEIIISSKTSATQNEVIFSPTRLKNQSKKKGS